MLFIRKINRNNTDASLAALKISFINESNIVLSIIEYFVFYLGKQSANLNNRTLFRSIKMKRISIQ